MNRRAVAGGALIIAASSVAAWAVAYPQSPISGALVRALADCAAVVTVGLAAVPMLDTARHRAELTRTAARPLAVSGAVWLFAEVVRMVVVAAQAAAVQVFGVGVRTVAEFALHTTVGRSGLVSILAALVVCAVAVAAPRTASTAVATVGVAAAGLAGRTLAGHLAESPVGGLAVAVHAMAAALWCGVLAALVLTVTHRGQWARVLPRFSQLALACVGVLLLAGVLGAVIRLDSPAELWVTGYGRLLSVKIIVTVVLLVLAWRNRAGWLPAARAHRATAALSRSRSLTELAIMVVTITFAAALAVAG
ncbi:CopD family protein [Mycobacterium sp. 21AC1]|uniref:CopD family protein n=1 Tax=[Mycobacterium] appelbergii TaxID=2939269 RepID=UPI0029390D55|nr:CopD family protein [Mycobacterium sp. 21AC1]MDV3123803.1 CopD family protein [Mycobacterium sp. 21AC1]